jgi:hypothetical protein
MKCWQQNKGSEVVGGSVGCWEKNGDPGRVRRETDFIRPSYSLKALAFI